jgi:hypothetical protein
MEIKQAAKAAGLVWLVFRFLAWLVTLSDPKYNRKQ